MSFLKSLVVRARRVLDGYVDEIDTVPASLSTTLGFNIRSGRPTDDGSFCDMCRQIILEYPSNVGQGFKLGTWESTVERASHGCSFCALISTALQFYRPSESALPLPHSVLQVMVPPGEFDTLECITVDGTEQTGQIRFDLTRISYIPNPRNPRVPINPDSPEALTQIKTWLASCTDHQYCTLGESIDLPSRLLDVSKGTSTIRLFSPSAEGVKKGRYVALSYCWGKGKSFTTTSKTLKSRQEGFLIDEMPKTFRDAVRVTRDLQLRYLWIDALCIIQGSDPDAQKDWEIESGRMESVYGDAFVTLAAAASDGCEGGLFYPRSSPLKLRTTPKAGTKKNPQPTKLIKAFITDQARNVKDEPLNSRAWALQERILSRRVLTYSLSGITFQCATNGEDILGMKDKWHKIYRYRFPNSPREPSAHDWHIIVQSFCSRNLTNPQDKLPAIAGLARRYEALTNRKNGRYMAGLWEANLLGDILWCQNEDLFFWLFPSSHKPAATSSSYRAPSWSWAAIDGIVCYLGIIPLDGKDKRFIAKVIECTTELATEDPFSSVLSGKLVISGQFKRASSIGGGGLDRNDIPYLIDSAHDQGMDFHVANLWLDDQDGGAIQKVKEEGHVYALLVLKTGSWYGLLLTEAPNEEGHYIRIGLFCSSTSEQFSWWENAVQNIITII